MDLCLSSCDTDTFKNKRSTVGEDGKHKREDEEVSSRFQCVDPRKNVGKKEGILKLLDDSDDQLCSLFTARLFEESFRRVDGEEYYGSSEKRNNQREFYGRRQSKPTGPNGYT